MNKLLLGILASLTITACDSTPNILISSKMVEYKLVGMKRPKHFRVDLVDMSTGNLYTNVAVSKHCNSWDTVQLGTKYTLETRVYISKDKTNQYTNINARKICPRGS
jgi:hypothetical protein